ncbi:MAG: threonine--tRNA ligase [Nitrososphaerota archaeon]|nr:threonine--tRNA ligase [Nitrososphaerota archaeon]
MRILLIHCERFEYIVRDKAVEEAEELDESNRAGRFENVLVVFTSVEKEDVKDPEGVVGQAGKEILEVYRSVKAKCILLYPYAHLSSELAGAIDAMSILKKLHAILLQEGVEVHRAAFGWYKGFTLVNFGHALAELSRSIRPGIVEKHVEKKDKFHRFIIMDEDGVEYEVDKANWRDCEAFSKSGTRISLLKTFVRNELEGKAGGGKEPSHIVNMRKLELVDYCPESDAGNMKWYPNGMLVKDLIMDYAFKKVALPWGAMKMQNPLLYRTDVEAIRQLQGEFHERDYRVEDNLVLRFASDPGAFPFVQKTVFTYKNMPFKVYEEAICFRKEQKGELTGLMRVRNFWMTDMHAFCMNDEQACEEYFNLSLMFGRLMDNIIAGGNWILGFEVVEEYYERYKELFRRIVKALRVPAFFKLMREMTHYYAFKNEFQAIFPNGENLQISTVQWDVKNGERFNICYYDRDGARKPVPIIIHASSFGSVERAVAAILENAAGRISQGKPPMLPVWLSPEQVRIIPVNIQRHMEGCVRIAERLEKEGARVGIDDRELTVSKRVAEAKAHWIPFIIVFGDRELETNILRVVVREESTLEKDHIEEMSLEGFAAYFRNRVEGMPTRPLYVSRELGKRVGFVTMRT